MIIWIIEWATYDNTKKFNIGNLINNENGWYFKYSQNINDAINNGFIPFDEFKNLEHTYYSLEIFETFSKRMPYQNNTNKDGHLATDNLKIMKLEKVHNDKTRY